MKIGSKKNKIKKASFLRNLAKRVHQKFPERHKVVITSFYCLFFLIGLRAATLHLSPPSEKNLKALASKQYNENIVLYPYRGSIFDRRKNPIAISTKKSSFFVNPRIFSPTPNEYQALASMLGVNTHFLKTASQKKSYFQWIKRRTSGEFDTKIKNLKIRGLFSVTEPSRFYPYQTSAAQLIGLSGIDNSGVLGLERQYDSLLKGVSSKVELAKDAKGRFIFRDSALASPEQPGNDLHLSIDLAIQEIAEKSLAHGIHEAKAKQGFAIVQDPHTGKVLALASYPTFNPNNPQKINNENSRLSPLLNLYEPGSVLKTLIFSSLVEQNLVNLDEEIDCEKNGIYYENNWRIRDSHPNGILSARDVLVHSSNIGTYKLAKRIGKKGLYEALQNLGVGDKWQRVGFPGQITGILADYNRWSGQTFANISFGQGILLSPLEIVGLYSAVANGGKLLKPIIVSHINSPDGNLVKENSTVQIRTLFSPKTSNKLKEVLQDVVERGSGTKAKMDEYTSAGKTGTTEKVDPATKAYSDDLRIASFVGFAPAKDTHLTIYVLIDEPQNKPYYGGTWAAPVFSDIARKALKYLNVQPDKTDANENLNLAKGILPSEIISKKF